MRLFIIAGEASGDLHGAGLVRALRSLMPNVEIQAWGGDRMEAAGAKILKHYRELAFMGFKEVVANLPTILKNFSLCKEQISAFKPDAVILIDYPGFNLRMAKWAKESGLRTIYYISPQLWAWKAGRIKQIRQFVDEMIVILPFEEQWYSERDYMVHYVGHPLMEVVARTQPDEALLKEINPDNKHLVALLPGSRKQEISRMLPVMLEAAKKLEGCNFVVAGAPAQEPSFYAQYLQGLPHIKLIFGKTYDILNLAHAAMVTSGTATLETALFGVPEVVCYKGSNLSYQIGKRLVKVDYISLVNLILGKMAVKELIQNDFTPVNLEKELRLLVFDHAYRQRIKDDYRELHEKLGEGGASLKAAKIIKEALVN